MRTVRGAGLRRCAAALLLPLLWLCAATPARAHDVPPSIGMLDIGANAIDIELQLQLSELGAALGLPLAASPATVIAQYGPRIEQYVGAHLALRSGDGRAYTLRIRSLGLRRTDNANWSSNDWLVLRAEALAPAGASTEVFSLDSTLIVERVLSHNALFYVRRDLRNGVVDGQPVPIGLIGFGHTRLQVDGSAGSWWQGFRRLFMLGMRHIAEGPDHLLFLLALLLPAPLLARAGRWSGPRDTARSVRAIVGVVSGFTIGHSLTLGLAACGWVTPPVRLVEVLIAVSILVSSVHAWRPLFAGREAWIAAGFGLVHGLAFAEVLSGLDFDALTLALSLLGFNLGIETMQLLAVAVALPPLLLLGRGSRYAAVRRGGAVFAGACALGWIGERAFGLPNPLAPLVEHLAPPPAWCVATTCLASALALLLLLSGRHRATPALEPGFGDA